MWTSFTKRQLKIVKTISAYSNSRLYWYRGVTVLLPGSNVNDIETKAQTFRYRSLLSEQNQNVLIWSAYYWNKSRTFQSVPKLFKIELERFGAFLSSKTKPERNRANFLLDRNVSIHLCFKGNKTELL